MTDRLVDAGIAFAVLAALFVPLERTWAARRQSHARPGVVADLAFFVLQYALMIGVFVALNDWMRGALPRAHVFSSWPIVAQFVVAVVAGDLAQYWGHRLCHRAPLLWRFHRVHHTTTHLDWLAAHREHPLDGLWSQVMLNAPAILLGVDAAIWAPWMVVRGLCAVFVHSNVRIPLGVFGLVAGDPVLHRWHHARVARCAHNFANLAPYLDVLFGTHYRPDDERFPLGVD